MNAVKPFEMAPMNCGHNALAEAMAYLDAKRVESGESPEYTEAIAEINDRLTPKHNPQMVSSRTLHHQRIDNRMLACYGLPASDLLAMDNRAITVYFCSLSFEEMYGDCVDGVDDLRTLIAAAIELRDMAYSQGYRN